MENRVPSIAKGHRILAAIMITDAVGFSARMSVDEALTLQQIDHDLNLIAELCDQYEGTLLKTTGDGLLMYFVSAVQAVSCGLAIQQKFIDLSADKSPPEYLEHRIGIHLGDILVSEADVMGNGVNIAARLQTYAKPRGLCISQTIYDVVKARLSLQAHFLGPLKLKNIEQAVPAYQVSLESKGEDTTCTVPMQPDGLLNQALQILMADANHQRIKKLIFATCKHAWENDPDVLNRFELITLLQTLRQRYPSLPDLRTQLENVVAGLNRQAVYRLVTETILQTLEPWYAVTPANQPAPEQETPTPQDSTVAVCESIARTLRQSEEFQRIHKLLYCLCHNTWENNVANLSVGHLPQLVHHTYRVAPTLADLRYHLRRIVKRLNRKAEYTRIANEIIDCFQSLYTSETEFVQLSEPSDGGRQGDGDTSVTSMVVDATSANPELTTLHSSLSAPVADSTERVTVAAAPSLPLVRDLSNLFDLRLDIMRYTNPLRAKILLYSCLHGPFSFTPSEWRELRNHTLNQLLNEIFDYCPTFSDLEGKLTIISHCLDNADENAQVATAISQAMRGFYPKEEQPRPGQVRSSRSSSAQASTPGSAQTSAVSLSSQVESQVSMDNPLPQRYQCSNVL